MSWNHYSSKDHDEHIGKITIISKTLLWSMPNIDLKSVFQKLKQIVDTYIFLMFQKN